MRNCTECNHKFTFYDRLKCIFNLKGRLKCAECKSIYKPKANIYKGIYYFLVSFVSMNVYGNIELNNYILKSILYMLTIVPILLLFDVLPHRWHKYIQIN